MMDEDMMTLEINRRVTDHANILVEHGRRITDVERVQHDHGKLLMVMQQNIAIQTELAEVGKALVKALGWVGIAARWVASIAAACALMTAAIEGGKKWLGW